MPGGTKRYGPGQALYGPGHGTVSSPVPVWHGLSRRWTPPEKVLTASCGSDIRKGTFFRNEYVPFLCRHGQLVKRPNTSLLLVEARLPARASNVASSRHTMPPAAK